jgi:hypothetical protein
MLGFAIAAFFELAQGKDVFQQVKAYPLLTVATFTLFTIASWIPFMQGQSYNVKSGPFTPRVRAEAFCLSVGVGVQLADRKGMTCTRLVNQSSLSSLSNTATLWNTVPELTEQLQALNNRRSALAVAPSSLLQVGHDRGSSTPQHLLTTAWVLSLLLMCWLCACAAHLLSLPLLPHSWK